MRREGIIPIPLVIFLHLELSRFPSCKNLKKSNEMLHGISAH